MPPSLETLFERLRDRATETADELELRQRERGRSSWPARRTTTTSSTNETGQVERTAERIDEIIATSDAATRTAASASSDGSAA